MPIERDNRMATLQAVGDYLQVNRRRFSGPGKIGEKKMEPLIAVHAKAKQQEAGGALRHKLAKPPVKTREELAKQTTHRGEK